jgi:C4-type Zn-finger protein
MAKEQKSADIGKPEILEGQECPICKQKTLALIEADHDIPSFWQVLSFFYVMLKLPLP